VQAEENAAQQARAQPLVLGLPKIDPSHAADYSASSISWQRRRIGGIEDTAAYALYLTSPAASRVTGKTFEVDGGAENPALEVPTPPL
jgi:NAD(P)-dependent dehydrogenase (short-subunit alcohol dehydrogenase family)